MIIKILSVLLIASIIVNVALIIAFFDTPPAPRYDDRQLNECLAGWNKTIDELNQLSNAVLGKPTK